jgi:hypothetical protein
MTAFRAPRTMLTIFFVAVFAAAVATVPSQLIAQQPYRVIAQWKIGGMGNFWDYLNVDPVTHRLYVAHSTEVQVVNTATGKIVGTIMGLKGAHGIAFDTVEKYGYISDGRGNAVVVFDRASLAKVASIDVEDGPDGIVFEPATKTVWTLNSRGTVTAIEAASRKVVATIKLGNRGEAPAVDGKGYVYGNVEGKIIQIDARTKQITKTWETGCEDASGLAVDVEGHRLFQACDGEKMSVVDSENGKLLGTSAIGDGPDSAGYSAKYKLAFASTGDGILSVVGSNANGYTTVEKLTTQKGARTMTYDPVTDRIYTASATVESSNSATVQPVPQPNEQSGPGGAGRSSGLGAPATPGGGGQPPRPNYVAGSFTVFVIGR